MAQANRSTSGSSSRQGGLAYQSLAGNPDRMGRNFTEAGRDSMGNAPRNSGPAGGSFARASSFNNGAMDRPIPVIIVGPRPLPVSGGGSRSGGGQGLGGGGLGGGGMDALMSGAGGKLLGGVGVALSVANGALQMMDAFAKLGDNTTTAREKLLSFAAAIPVVGGTLEGIAKSTLSLADRLKDPERYQQQQQDTANHGSYMANKEAELNKIEQEATLMRKGRSLGFEEQALKEFPSLDYLKPGRTANDAGNPGLAAQHAAEDATQKARRELSIAQKEHAAASQDSTKADNDWKEAQYGTTGEGIKGGFLGAFGNLEKERKALTVDRDAEPKDVVGKRGLAGTAAYETTMLMGGSIEKALVGTDYFARGSSWAARNSPVGSIIDTVDQRTGGTMSRAANKGAAEIAVAMKSPADAIAAQEVAEAKYAEAQKLGLSAREAAERLEQRGMDLAQKKLDLARAENNEQKAKVGILQEQQDKLKEAAKVARGNAEQFGSYDETKQQAVSTALQSYMQNGRKGITQDQHDLLASTNITREFVAEKGGSVATNGDEYRKIMALTKQKDAAFLDQEAAKVGQEKMTVQSKIDVKFQVDEEKMQKDMTKVFTEVMTKLLTLMKASENNNAKMKQGAASSEKSQ